MKHHLLHYIWCVGWHRKEKTQRTWRTQIWIFCQSESMTGVRTVSKSCFFLYNDIWIQLYTLKHYIPMPTKLFLFNRNRKARVRAPVTIIQGFYCHYQVLSKMTSSCSFKTNHWNDFTGHYDHKKLRDGGSYAYQDSLPDFASHCPP